MFFSLRDRSKTIVVGIYAIIFGAGENLPYLAMRPDLQGLEAVLLCDVSANAISSVQLLAFLVRDDKPFMHAIRMARQQRQLQRQRLTSTAEFQIPPQVARYASFMFSFIGRGACTFSSPVPSKIACPESHAQEREVDREEERSRTLR